MAKQKKKAPKVKIEWLNHVLGFAGVVLGVLIAFWLNNWAGNRREQQIAEVALKNIRSEVARNQSAMDTLVQVNARQLDFLNAYLPLVDDNMTFLGSSSQFDSLQAQFPDLLLARGRLDIEIELLGLPEVAWKTSLNSSILSSIDFNLLYVINESYDLQEKVAGIDNLLISDLRNIGNGRKNDFHSFQRTLGTYMQLSEQLLLEKYPRCLKEIDLFLADGSRDTDALVLDTIK
jgi:hypothetical protein